MFVRRMSAALLIAGTVLLAGGVPALAHTALKSSTPAKGSSIASAPPEIVLTFSEPVQVEAGAITVTGPGGVQWTVGPASVAGAVVTAPATPAGPAGQYTINYRVISEDGDPVRGTVPFALTAAVPVATSTTSSPTAVTTTTTTPPTTTVTAPPPATTQQTTPTAQQTGDSGGIPAWVWIVGAIIVVGAGVFAGMRMSKGKSPQDS
ncbi:methionine-rich copper-binding protein CopC [Kibdelosporangium banguiense]|uniref:Methionine-rich copper-binding protein CopC n=1 Tax=Kibdelosporangium banguiense TaxID=1365924 RepID=A0ABS4TK24_9PSEU|nr:copper resistance CopC family protein [Kibdelosporangium banguiense]MBP2324365.1 methionine-rich copper-binding protein CopC [Kibdelosporangium banguiense]